MAYDLAKRSGAIVDGIDWNEENIIKAKQLFSHPQLNFKVGDALKLTDGKQYDTVILSNVLEHLEARPSFLKRIQNITRAKRILIRVPLFEREWRVPLKKELGVDWRLDPDHKTEYTMEGFVREMEQADLIITHQEVRWGEIWCELIPNSSQ